ncbi:hypothetical protein FRC02_004414 [Tulasnella sp. 418]|nr:hypothetical protein FRC02_004414 [Tulasnella sp. 418]
MTCVTFPPLPIFSTIAPPYCRSSVSHDDPFVNGVLAKRVAVPTGAKACAGQGGTIRIKTSKCDAGYDSQLALGGAGNGAAEHANALQKIQDIRAFAERHLAKRKDNNWKDVTENAFQPLPVPIPQHHFRPIRGQTSLLPSQQQTHTAGPISF